MPGGLKKGILKDMPRTAKNTEKQLHTRPCAWNGCAEQAEYRAPKRRRVEDKPLRDEDCHFFCLGHIREHNKSWNFFAGMTDAEIQKFQIDAVIGHRITQRREHRGSAADLERLHNAANRFMHDLFAEDFPLPNPLPLKEQSALKELELTYPVSQADVKQRYKTLVKRYHPDVNKGDKTCEERFKRVTDAYRTLSHSELLQ